MIDARGRSCPEPVVMIRDAMKSGKKEYEMVVDAQVCVENVTRFAEHAGYQVSVSEKNGEYVMKIRK